jgi:ABC-2 type transport system permease protein
MQVFKLYFKIIRKNIAMLTIYFIIFIGVSILFISLSQVSKAATFTETKCKVAFISYDDSELINGLKEFIGSNAKIINIKDDKESLQDALFFRKVECIIKVPQGFTQRFF